MIAGRLGSMLAVCLLAAACGGLRVGGVAPPMRGGLVLGPVDAPARYTLMTEADATVHSAPEWKGEPLGEQEWLMAGTSAARRVHWFTYVSFDLTPVPAGTDIAGATLHLPVAESDGGGAFVLHRVVGSWGEGEVAWIRQPRVEPFPVASLALDPDSTQPTGTEIYFDTPAISRDAADVTRVVHEAVGNGDAQIAFLILPAQPWRQARRRWLSRESIAGEPTSYSAAPLLVIDAGVPPPPPSAAQRDLVRGGRLDIPSE